MTNTSSERRRLILQEIASIERMERGRLCPFKNPKRAADPNAPTYFKHQAWHEGKNHTCYVSADKAPALEEAIEGYQTFRRLSEEYAQLTIEETRENLQLDEQHRKKKRSSKPRISRKPKPSSKSPKAGSSKKG